jgi:hypothetical protein
VTDGLIALRASLAEQLAALRDQPADGLHAPLLDITVRRTALPGADVLYTRANVELALRLLPRLVAPGGAIRLADPGRAGARDFLAAARR